MAATIGMTGQWTARNVHMTTWSGFTTSNDIGVAQDGSAPHKYIQATGTLATAGSPIVTIQGSNNSATGPYVTLNTVTGGAALIVATTGGVQISDTPRWIRPTVSATTADTSFNIIMMSSWDRR